MVSLEFKSVVAEGNLLRTRIILKDSFLVDPTFVQLNAMLNYAKMSLPDLIVPYDGEYLENDQSKWTTELMNEELVLLVTNFSEARIEHLKLLVSQVLEEKAKIIRQKRLEKNRENDFNTKTFTNSYARADINSNSTCLNNKEVKRKRAMKKFSNEARKISEILQEVEKNRAWKMSNIDELERTAEEIVKAVREYRTNR